jgi:predicted ester cyclase
MSIEKNKEVVRRAYELFNRKEIDSAYELIAPDCVIHFADGDMSVEQGKQFDAMFSDAFPDISFTIEDMVAEGDKVFIRVTLRGTHQGEFMGIAPTGNKINITNANLIKIIAGKWAEFWNTSDRLRLMQQLGVIPKQ